MGQDKALLSFRSPRAQTFLEVQISTLLTYCAGLLLVVRDRSQAEQYRSLVPSSIRFVLDQQSDMGPLMGLYSGLHACSTTHALVTAVDTPLLQPALLALLLEQPRTEEMLVPVVENVPQVLLALYPRSLLPSIEERLQSGRRDPSSLLQTAPVRFLYEPQLRVVDPDLRSFANINTPEDFARL